MYYYKWLYDDRDQIQTIPGFTFCDAEDAQLHRVPYMGWVASGTRPLSLYTFVGMEPAPFPILLSGFLAFNKHREKATPLTTSQLQEAQKIFDNLPLAYFFDYGNINEDIVKLFFDFSATFGCIKTNVPNPEQHGHSGIEAYYAWPVILKRIGRTSTLKK